MSGRPLWAAPGGEDQGGRSRPKSRWSGIERTAVPRARMPSGVRLPHPRPAQDLPGLRRRRRQDLHHVWRRRTAAWTAARHGRRLRRAHGRPRRRSWWRAWRTGHRWRSHYQAASPSGDGHEAAMLRRRPQVALVDELAHSNAPGAEYPKR